MKNLENFSNNILKTNKQFSFKEKIIFEINRDFNKKNPFNNYKFTNEHTNYVINSLIGKLINNYLCKEDEEVHILEAFYCLLSNQQYNRCDCIYDWD